MSTTSKDSVEVFTKGFYEETGSWEGLYGRATLNSQSNLLQHASNFCTACLWLWERPALIYGVLKQLSVLKVFLKNELGSLWLASLKPQWGNEPDKLNGATNGGASPREDIGVNDAAEGTKSKEVLIQVLFDAVVLQNALEVPNPVTLDLLKHLESQIQEQIELDQTSRKRIQQSAKEYWRRSNLLFGAASLE